MASVDLVLFIIAILFYIGILAQYIFERFNLPDVIILILTGIILGDYGFKLMSIDQNSLIVNVFTTLALIIIIFEGALNIDTKKFFKNFSRSLKISSLLYILSSLGVFLFLRLINFMDMPTFPLLAFSFLITGTASIVTYPLIENLKINEKVKNLLKIEATITDALSILFVITFLLYMNSKSSGNPIGMITKSMISSASIAIVLGVLLAFFWIQMLREIKRNKLLKRYKYLLTISFLFIVYVTMDYYGGSAPLAVFIFGLILGNINTFKGIIKIKDKNLIDNEISKPTEQISFVLKVFFFVMVGVLYRFDLLISIYSLIIIALIAVIRYLIFYYYKFDEKMFSSLFMPKGISVVIMSMLIAKYAPQEFLLLPISIVTYSIIIASIVGFIKQTQIKKSISQNQKKKGR